MVSLLAKLHLENHAHKPIIAKAVAEGLLDAQKIDYMDRFIEGAIKSKSKTLVLD